jgi:hypothetical protein
LSLVKDLVALTTGVLGATFVAVFADVSAQEHFVVSGLVVLEGGDGSAWLQEPSLTENQIVRVRRGDSVGQWRVSRILDDRVELEGSAGGTNYVMLGRASERTSEPAAGQEPLAAPPASVEEDPAAQARALAHLLGTGGDEGVWDDRESALSPPAVPARPAR